MLEVVLALCPSLNKAGQEDSRTEHRDEKACLPARALESLAQGLHRRCTTPLVPTRCAVPVCLPSEGKGLDPGSRFWAHNGLNAGILPW